MLCERCECSEGCNLSHLKPMKINGKVAFCEGVNTFLGAKNTYRYVWIGRWVGMVGMIREQFFTTRRFVVSTQGLEETSPGLEKTSRRVVKTNPGLVWGGGRWRM